MTEGTNRDAGREAAWRRIVQDQARSGVTIRQFCRDNDLTESAFYFWRRELQRRETQRPQRQRRQARQERQPPTGHAPLTPRDTDAPAFVPVSVSQPAGREAGGAEAARIEIILPGDVRVHVGAGVDRQALSDVVAVLREARAC